MGQNAHYSVGQKKRVLNIVIIKVHFSLQIIVIIKPQGLNPRYISSFDNVFNLATL